MASLGQIAKSPPGAPIWRKSRMGSLFWPFWQILIICYQNRLLGQFSREVHRTLAILQKTPFWSQKDKVDFKWLPWAKLQNPVHEHQFGENHAWAACLGHFVRFLAFVTKIAFWVNLVVKCTDHSLYHIKRFLGARKTKST